MSVEFFVLSGQVIAGFSLRKLSFSKKNRLVRSRQFRQVLEANARAADELLTVFVKRNNCGYPRLGVSAPKSLGNAVTRNRFKRLIREVFRHNQYDIAGDYDYVVLISRGFLRKSTGEQKRRVPRFTELEGSFLKLARQAPGKYELRGQDEMKS